MLEDFISYWVEASDTAIKLRYEKQKAFNIERRLGTWAKNSKQFNKDAAGSKIERALSEGERAINILNGKL